jgi:hypothetical protein
VEDIEPSGRLTDRRSFLVKGAAAEASACAAHSSPHRRKRPRESTAQRDADAGAMRIRDPVACPGKGILGRIWACSSQRPATARRPTALIAVRPRLWRCSPEMPAGRISRSTRLRPTRTPCASRKSAWIRGAPYAAMGLVDPADLLGQPRVDERPVRQDAAFPLVIARPRHAQQPTADKRPGCGPSPPRSSGRHSPGLGLLREEGSRLV